MEIVKKHPLAAVIVVFVAGMYLGPRIQPKLAGIPVVGKLA